jgi:hypothetical protein
MAEARWQSGPGWRTWLAAGLALLVLAVILLARCAGDPGSEVAEDGAATPKSGNDSVVEAVPSNPAPAAVSAATSFVQAWLGHPPGQSTRQWWQRISQYAEPSFARQLELTDPARVPGSELRGGATATSVSSNRVVLRFDTDAGAVLVTCVRLGEPGAQGADGKESIATAAPQVWKVSDIAPGGVEQAQPNARAVN